MSDTENSNDSSTVDKAYAVNLNFKTKEHTPDVAAVAKSIKSTVVETVNSDVSIIVATNEESDYMKAATGFFRLLIRDSRRQPVEVYEDARDAVLDQHEQDMMGWGFSVQETWDVSEKED